MVDKANNRYLEEPEREKRVYHLKMMVINLLNESIKELSESLEEDISQYIYEVVAVGNSTMRNLLFGLDVSSLGVIPYESVHKTSVIKIPEELGLNINKSGTVYGGALIGGHVGSDITADILASGMYKEKDMSLLIDIGTNGEIVLGNKDRMIAASCAAGGAFEGTTVSCGVGGIRGAIKKIELVDGVVTYSTIGNRHPIGVCGSGLIDLLAELLKKGIMTNKARIKQDFLITGDLKLTQNDIFQLITSKAAVKTGWQILLKYYPLDISEVKKIYLSGGFGNFIDIKNSMAIGLIPNVEESKVIKIGNGALEGTREMLLCKESKALSEEIAEKTEHIRTNEVEKEFDYVMAENMYF